MDDNQISLITRRIKCKINDLWDQRRWYDKEWREQNWKVREKVGYAVNKKYQSGSWASTPQKRLNSKMWQVAPQKNNKMTKTLSNRNW